ncbi:MAG: preprotein translocase subunit SecG [Gammaproteobacteria bacterium]|nr:preprotein translocase subunit SecG [Gammaproteobacteria bacterium]MDE0246779.1 preprotein translocase subunit SecG [Gammaproteobacteria bacterium]MDE0394486.1 preprotein translocase subunit SecG [Gammaproteobacteria bacterium]
MYGFLLAILLLDGLFLSVVILLQAGKGGGLAAMGGSVTATDGLFGGRQATTFLTRASWVAGGIFMVLALLLAILSSRTQLPASILQEELGPAGAPTPVLPEAVTPAPAPVEVETPGAGVEAEPLPEP